MIWLPVSLGLVLAALEILTRKLPMKGVKHTVSCSKGLVDPEEVFTLDVSVENDSLLPITFLRIREAVPPDLKWEAQWLQEVKLMRTSYIAHLQWTLFLLPREKRTRTLPVHIDKRGRYAFHGGEVYRGSFLGLKEICTCFPRYQEVVAAPRPCGEGRVLEALGGILGEVSRRRYIFEDPVLHVGFREYTGREPRKQISFLETARQGRLMVRQPDYTLEPSACVLLDIHCPKNNLHRISGEDAERVENCFSLARTLCETLEEKRMSYAFFTNASADGAPGYWKKLETGLGGRHLDTVLEGLGRAGVEAEGDFFSLLETVEQREQFSAAYLLVTPVYRETFREPIRYLRERTGGTVTVFTAAGEVLS